jgi:cell wall-associated NlpC family hydrolase
MPIKKLTLGLGLLLAGAVTVQAETYRIRQGDTISEIAARFHVKSRDILQANGLTAKSNLKLGRALVIPSASKSSDRHAKRSVPSRAGTYVVRNGDHDWSIAKKHGTVASQLRKLNPGLDWRSLQIGQRIVVPGAGAAPSHTSSKASRVEKISSVGTYKVREGDNDWIIARRLDIKATVLRRLNPSVNWDRVQIGQTLRVPGSGAGSVNATAKVAATASRIRSRYAIVAREDATIRRNPSTNAAAVTTVDAGTRVTVLDRDGDWYRLRFPKGTEGWMRGDLLKAAAAPREVIVASRRERKAKATNRYVATKKSTPRRSSSAKRPQFTQESTYAMEVSNGGSQDRILSKAQSMRGVRYRWGASSRSATDCSGFTSQVFRSNGYRIPRTSAEQSRTGAKVDRSSLRPGDLVFFKTRRGTRVSHVGIYTGNGKFIHASSGGGKVQVNSLSDGYYNKRYVTARRVVKGSSKKVAKKTSKKLETPSRFPDQVPSLESTDRGE